MDLNILWFILIAVLYLAFFFLEGFDFGVGMLLPFLGKNDTQRRVIINTIGPHWDGNEVWLLTAGGATFAAFPHWYATMFSGFYPAFCRQLCKSYTQKARRFSTGFLRITHYVLLTALLVEPSLRQTAPAPQPPCAAYRP
ncbi:MAG: cytochrome d ubiquinol oxidase subunit II [Anaerolineales bacterium]|nr:cytochrome d ubiquinol oxidase subunit II [Anaerolineales bacterium]